MSSNDNASDAVAGPSLRDNAATPDSAPTSGAEVSSTSETVPGATKFIKSIFEGTTPAGKLIAGDFVKDEYVSVGYPQVTENIIAQILAVYPGSSMHADTPSEKLEKAFSNARWPKKAAYEGRPLRSGDIGNNITRFNPFSNEFEHSLAGGILPELGTLSATEKSTAAFTRMGKNVPMALLSSVGIPFPTSDLAQRVFHSARNANWNLLNYGRILEYGPAHLQGSFLDAIRALSNRDNMFQHEMHFLLSSISKAGLMDLLFYFSKVVSARPDSRPLLELEKGNLRDSRRITPQTQGSLASRHPLFDSARHNLFSKQTSTLPVQLINIFERYDPICPSVCLSFAFRASGIASDKDLKDGFVVVHHYWIDLPADLMQGGLIENVGRTGAEYVRRASFIPSPSILNGNSAKALSLILTHLGVDVFSQTVKSEVGRYGIGLKLTSISWAGRLTPYLCGELLADAAFTIPHPGDISMLADEIWESEEPLSEEEEREKSEYKQLFSKFKVTTEALHRLGVETTSGEAISKVLALSSASVPQVRSKFVQIRKDYLLNKLSEMNFSLEHKGFIDLLDLQKVRRESELRGSILEGIEIERVVNEERAKSVEENEPVSND